MANVSMSDIFAVTGNAKQATHHSVGKVTAVSGNELTVTVGGSSIKAENWCGAGVGAIVLLDYENRYRAIAARETSGSATGWTWVKHPDGTFDAWYKEVNGSTGSMTASGGIAYSATFSKSIPSGIGVSEVLGIYPFVSSGDGYMLSMAVKNISTSAFSANFIRYGSSGTASNLTYGAYVHGTWS